MKLKKLMALLLTGAMAGSLLAGCGGNPESEATGNDAAVADDGGSAGSGSAENDGDAAGGDDAANSSDAAGSDAAGDGSASGEMTEITVVLRTLGTVDESASEAVEEAVNEITQSQIQVAVDLMWVDSAKYETQVPMMIAGSEKMDLMMYTPNPSTTYNTMMAQNQLMDITDYISEYGPEIQNTLGDDLLAATSKDGRIYGVGNYGPLTFKAMVLIRRDLADAAGVTELLENATTWSEVEEGVKAISEQSGLGMVNADVNGSVLMANPALCPGDNFSDGYVYDNLGDSANLFMANKDTGKVECMYFNEDVKEVLRRTYDWYQEGLVYKDAAMSQDFGATLLKNGVGCGLMTTTEVGGEQTSIATTGYDMIVLNPVDESASMITTGNLTKFGFCVPVTALEPEAAIKFLNLLYTADSGLGDLLSWGIEGRDYVINEDGLAEYPEGVTAETVPYHIADFLYGNRLNITPWAGNEPNVREIQAQANEAAEVSPYLGFNVDNTGLEATLTSCINVFEKYKTTVLSGSTTQDFDTYYQEFLDELTANGIDELVAAYQAQLDEWVANNQ